MIKYVGMQRGFPTKTVMNIITWIPLVNSKKTFEKLKFRLWFLSSDFYVSFMNDTRKHFWDTLLLYNNNTIKIPQPSISTSSMVISTATRSLGLT